jgi:hypothetical protein
MAAAWLAENVPPGSWVLDPLGASPALTLEMAQAGYRVLVAANNPVLYFMIDTLARALRTPDFQSVLAELAMARRGDERLEQHLRSLYLTECDTCGETVEALAFLWRKGDAHPYARLYRCQRCGDSAARERPVIQADLDRLAAMGGDRMQRARAIQRVVMDDDEPRADVEAALENYLARPLYVLFTLLNRMEGLSLSADRRRMMQALLLSVFDAGCALWPWPAGRTRPRQLTTPPQFRENNLWLALEESAAAWTGADHPRKAVVVSRWPDLPEVEAGQGAICLFRGRVKALLPVPPEIGLGAVVTVFPRPNQAFWTLSVLWAGWLWGAEAALPLRNVLERRRYDWNWHTTAVHSALSAAGASLPVETPFFGLMPEAAPGFLSAVVLAGQSAGFDLQGLALRGEQELVQALWKPAPRSPAVAKAAAAGKSPMLAHAGAVEAAARAGIEADLRQRGEPAPYLYEYAAGLVSLARAGVVSSSPGGIPGDLLSRVQASLARAFSDRAFLRRYGAKQEESQADEERGWWWLAKPGAPLAASLDAPSALPLADQVEIEVVRFMQKQPVFQLRALDEQLCARFTGLLTPSSELVRACVESYGEPVHGQAGSWRLRSGETTSARKSDLQELRGALAKAAGRLGYAALERGSQVIWQTSDGGEVWRFYLLASSIISRFVLGPPEGTPANCALVLPGSRARLLSLKLRRDPRLAEAADGWRMVKFRHLRAITAREDLTPERWSALLMEDPLMEDATQMHLFKP